MQQHARRFTFDNLIRRARAWAPATKVGALFLFPCPLLLAVVAALIDGDAARVAFAAGGLASCWSGGVAAARALAAEARYLLGERPVPPAVPWKLVSALLTVVGIALAASAAGHGASMVFVFALLGAIGHLAFFGRDLRPVRVRCAVLDGVDSAAVTRQLNDAYDRLAGLDAAARQLAVPELRERVSRLAHIGRAILGQLARRPHEAPRARRFLNHYLDEAQRLSLEYARTHVQGHTTSLEPPFRDLLQEFERRFEEQHQLLMDRDLLSLDVDIAVMNARLKREGLG
jgi:5-bromo-4-chloroindolyl phosphate hydrolysis protein